MSGGGHTAKEMMVVAAARLLRDTDVCLVGIGMPSAACNLARLTHAPQVKLIYESGTIGTRPEVLPLSIGDGELCETALVTVSLPEMFRYWIQGGRITVGFLGGAQIDRFCNLNTTVIGGYARPKVRLPGAGGAPEIGAGCRETYVIMELGLQRFVEKVDFITTLGYGGGGSERRDFGNIGKGPTKVITDYCIFEPEAETMELVVTALHPGATRGDVLSRCGWEARFAASCGTTPAPSPEELRVLRELQRRTAAAHSREES